MCGMYSASPAVAVVEEIAAGWVLELLGLPRSASVGFVTGAQMANFSCLAAARGELLRRAGWDADAQGLFGAPPIEVLVGEEVHVTVLRALGYLGLGHDRVTRVGVDANGAMDPVELKDALRKPRPRYSSVPRQATSTLVRAIPSVRSRTSRLSTARGFTSMERSACGPPRRRACRAWWPAGTGPTLGPSMRTSGSTFPTTARSRSLRRQRRYRIRWRSARRISPAAITESRRSSCPRPPAGGVRSPCTRRCDISAGAASPSWLSDAAHMRRSWPPYFGRAAWRC
jgi:hypothetical protein